MNRKKLRDSLRFAFSFLFFWLYIPHLVLCLVGENKSIYEDVKATGTDSLSLPPIVGLLYLLHTNRYFRSLFYYRIGPLWKVLISWLRPGDKYFIFSATTIIEGGMRLYHPYSTILNAEKIGKNFGIAHGTTLGVKNGLRPIVGDNVSLAPGVIIIGGVHVGNNVTIGAGSVVVKDIPDNAIVAGNPARIIKFKG